MNRIGSKGKNTEKKVEKIRIAYLLNTVKKSTWQISYSIVI